jgi:nucleotide-binding universal stress UspA family protein
MNSGPILIACDLEGTTRVVVEAGLALADRLGAPAHLVHVDAYGHLLGERFHSVDPKQLAEMKQAYRTNAVARMRSLLSTLQRDPEAVELSVREGHADEELSDAAKEARAQAIVLGARGRAESLREGVGRTALRTARRASCGVFTIDVQAPFRIPSRILLATDLAEPRPTLARWGARVAGAFGAHVVLTHVSEITARVVAPYMFPARALEDHHEQLIERLARMRIDLLTLSREYGPGASEIETHYLVAGDVPSALLDMTRRSRVDLVIVGTHGRRGIARWMLGSVAESVLHHAHASVLTVHETEGS